MIDRAARLTGRRLTFGHDKQCFMAVAEVSVVTAQQSVSFGLERES